VLTQYTNPFDECPNQHFRVYDNGGETFDRFTVVYLNIPNGPNSEPMCLGMSENPMHPQGYGEHAYCTPGNHLGALIRFADLPDACQRLVESELNEIADTCGENRINPRTRSTY